MIHHCGLSASFWLSVRAWSPFPLRNKSPNTPTKLVARLIPRKLVKRTPLGLDAKVHRTRSKVTWTNSPTRNMLIVENAERKASVQVGLAKPKLRFGSSRLAFHANKAVSRHQNIVANSNIQSRYN